MLRNKLSKFKKIKLKETLCVDSLEKEMEQCKTTQNFTKSYRATKKSLTKFFSAFFWEVSKKVTDDMEKMEN